VRRVEGVLVRYNKKSVTVITDEGERWNVAPGLLQRGTAADSVRENRNIVQMRKAEPAK
jgi:hypothetical protein